MDDTWMKTGQIKERIDGRWVVGSMDDSWMDGGKNRWWMDG